ncbi:MAG: hypothetical protein V7K57_04100 [Nostoc sp.]|uniref:hypothetical protein n=1 Tax=Nostoc sp. TaxID=1180 RepID=UPI002FF81DF5
MTDHYNAVYTSYARSNQADFHQSELFGGDKHFFTADFERGELISGYALSIMELVRGILGENYWYFAEFPLQIACPKREGVYLEDKTLWQFWVNSRVDIIVMNPNLGEHCRKACLMLECQSPWHDLEDTQRRDRTKFDIIASTKIPLIYVRYADYPRILRFWSHANRDEVFYNAFTQDGKTELKEFFTRYCL